jgi:hypothetical protein
LRNQYAGKDKWEVELKKQDDILHNREWKGQSNFLLEKFVTMHRNAFVSMQQCAEHVTFQLPTEHTRVGYLLDAIQTSDAGLQAAIAAVKTDDKPSGKRNHFEKMASYIVPYDPVTKKRQTGGKQTTNISGVDGGEVSSGFGSKQGIGKIGVHLRYHNKQEYSELPVEQCDELREWRKTTNQNGKRKDGGKTKQKWTKGDPKGDSKGNAKGGGKKNIKNMISSAVAEEASKWQKRKNDDDIDSIIMALQVGATQGPEKKKVKFDEVSATTVVNTSALKSIIGRVRNKDGKDQE